MTFIADNTYRSFATLVAQYVAPTDDMLILTNSIVDLHEDVLKDATNEAEEAAIEQAEVHYQQMVERFREEVASLENTIRIHEAARTNTHEVLVFVALGSEPLLREVGNDKRIYAIKRLRALTGVGLKAAKDAVNDQRVLHAGEAYSPLVEWERELLSGDPWSQGNDYGCH